MTLPALHEDRIQRLEDGLRDVSVELASNSTKLEAVTEQTQQIECQMRAPAAARRSIRS